MKSAIHTRMLGAKVVADLCNAKHYNKDFDGWNGEVIEVYQDREGEIRWNTLCSDGTVRALYATHAGQLFRVTGIKD